MSILKLILGAILRFFWSRAEDWYQEELRYQHNKRIILQEVKDVAREAAKANDQIAVDRESIDDSLMRLERFAVKRVSDATTGDSTSIGRPLFGDAYRGRTAGDSVDDSEQLPELPSPDAGRDQGDSQDERSGVEPVGAGLDDSVPTT